MSLYISDIFWYIHLNQSIINEIKYVFVLEVLKYSNKNLNFFLLKRVCSTKCNFSLNWIILNWRKKYMIYLPYLIDTIIEMCSRRMSSFLIMNKNNLYPLNFECCQIQYFMITTSTSTWLFGRQPYLALKSENRKMKRQHIKNFRELLAHFDSLAVSSL